MLAVTLPLMGLAVAKGASRLFAPRTVLLAKGYASAFDDDPAKVAEHAKEHETDPEYHETMFRTFRMMMDAAEPEVVETLGYMAGVYRGAGRYPDKVFRGMGRLLCDLERGELASLVAMLRGIDSVNEVNQAPSICVVIGDELSHEEVHASTPSSKSSTLHYKDIVRVVDSDDREGDVGIHPLARRFFMLLKREGLAGTPAPRGQWNDDHKPSGDKTLEVPREIFKTFLHIVDPRPASAVR